MFKRGKPQEVVRSIKESLTVLAQPAPAPRKVVEETTKNLSFIRGLLADPEHGPEAAVLICNECFATDVLPLMIQTMGKLEFEARRDASFMFVNLLRRQVGGRSPTAEYISRSPITLDVLLRGYEDPEVALTCGAMLRECSKFETLNKLMLHGDIVWALFKYLDSVQFDIACDAFATLKEILTNHKEMASGFLETNYDKFFDRYMALLEKDNFVTRTQSLKLLGELLLDRANFNVMTRFISSSTNLRVMMNLLRDRSKRIQYESFHVFKVFVANPNKPPLVLRILIQNKEKLIRFLNNFQNDKDDEQFKEEKQFLIKQVVALPDRL
ncbi:calcium-binding protein 39 [Pelomyxa schiedti]|nr:calcium-binding protein 39 [Pelomyxa schiedti]KAH3764924.1 calcium-binding protein 39 [Pelomyxa schiedti]